MFKTLLRLLLLLPCFLFANQDSEPVSIASTDGLPSNIVNGCVCVITGDYSDHAIDLAVPGPEPLISRRNYSSLGQDSTVQSDWFINHADRITLGTTIKEGYKFFYTNLAQPSGARLFYTSPHPKDTKATMHFTLTSPKGWVNFPSRMSGRQNYHHQKLTYSNEKGVKVVTPEGSVKRFKSYEKKKKVAYLEVSEEKLNGHKIVYNLNDVGNLIDISLKGPNGKVYSSIGFSAEQGGDSIVIKGSDGNQASLTYDKKTYKNSDGNPYAYGYLKSIETSYSPKITYSHTYPSVSGPHLLINRKSYSDERYLEIDYYRKGVNKLKNLPDIEISDKGDPRLNRVKQLIAPVGPNGSAIVTHQFVYHGKTETTKLGKEILNGETEVYDAYLHKMLYAYNKEHRLKSVESFSGTHPNFNSYRKSYYLWSEENLKGIVLKDSQRNVLKAQYFEYDDRGNTIEEKLCGRLTSLSAPSLHVNKELQLEQNGYEFERKTFTYSNDGLNLILSEKDNSGRGILYAYEPGKDLLNAKLITFQDAIKKREFFEYNEDAVITKKIVDDGVSRDKNDLTGVTERHITYIYPRTTAPYGLPERIDEMYLEEGQEKLLKRVIYHYSTKGYLLQQDTYGSDSNFAYTESWEYDEHGNVTKETDALGQVTVKKYDKFDNLICVEGPRPGYVTHYTYDYLDRMTKQEENYDGKQFVTSCCYDYLGNKTASTDYYGQETRYEYDEFSRVVRTIHPEVADENGNVRHPTETCQYNELDQIVAATNAKGQTVHTEYNVRGQPLCITYPDGSKEMFVYNLSGSLRQKIEKNGSYIIYERDYQDRITKEEIYAKNQPSIPLKCTILTYDAFHLLTTIDPEGLQTIYEYDGAGRLIKTIKGDLQTTQAYDSLGRVAEIREQFGDKERVHQKSYDVLNRVIKEQTLDSDGNLYHVSQFTYDEQGNQTSIKTGSCGTTHTEYNPHKQPTKIVDSTGHMTKIDYFHQNTANGCVLRVETTDPLGFKTIQLHDALGRIVENTRKNSFGEEVSCQRICYDLCGNKCYQADDVMQGTKILRTTKICWSYNDQNQVVELVQAVKTPDQKIIKYQYNGIGQLEAKIKPDGIKLLYTYDALGRLETFKSSDGSLFYHYKYNLSDEPIEIKDKESSTIRKYDQYGQLIFEKLGNGLSLQYIYDDLGHPISVILPDESAIEYIHNAMDLKEVHRKVGTEVKYAHLNQKHDLSGHVTVARLAGQQKDTAYKYDKMGRCVAINNSYLTQNVPKKGYDAAGNLLSYQSDSTKYSFTYDEYYQLKSEKGHTQHEYECDSLSNRLKKDDQVCKTNHLNQLLKQGSERFVYDANGNLIQRIGLNETITYKYDALDRLVSVITPNNEVHYTYDPLNRRLSKQEKDQPAKLFFYQGMEEIGMWENNGITELKVLGEGRKRRLIAMELNQKAYVPIQDIFGHPTCLVDLEGNVLEKYKFTAFGEEQVVDANDQPITPQNPWRYAGKRFDSETGFIAFGMRYYDPTLGRWVTADPIGYEDGPNLYAYLHHSPLIYYDAFGLFTDCLFGLAGCFLGIPSNFFNTPLNTQIQFGNVENHFNQFGSAQDYAALTILNDSPQMCYSELAQCYDLNHERIRKPNSPLRKDNPHCFIIFTNGVFNDFKSFKETMNYLGEMVPDQNIYGIFNPTFGLNDVMHYHISKNYYKALEPAQLLKLTVEKLFKEFPDASGMIIGHSYGAVNTRNGLMGLSKDLRQRLDVVAIAPGSPIDQELAGKVRNYCSEGDIIHLADIPGLIRCRNNITYLKRHPQASMFVDHGIMSETFRQPLREVLNNFIE